MRVFVTGASGHIGQAVLAELRAHGHVPFGLARSDEAAARVVAAGAEVVRGDLDALDVLAAAARRADGVVHLAFDHDVAFFSGAPDGFAAASMQEVRAVRALGEALTGSDKPLVTTAGTAQLALVGGLTRTGTEEDTVAGGPRIDGENATIAFAARGVRSSVVRLPPTVHSELPGSGGFVSLLVAAAQNSGHAVYVGDGANVWPAVHTLDVAVLYRLALESAPAGTRLHGVAEEGVPFRAIAEAIGRGLGVPVEGVGPEAAPQHLGAFAAFAQVHNPVSSARTRALLGWAPTHPSLLADLAKRHYFAGPAV